MSLYREFEATFGLGTTLWSAWRTLKAFLDDAEHIDETFLELQQLVTLLHSALLSVDAVASARIREYKNDKHPPRKEQEIKEEEMIVGRLCESRTHCKTTITLLGDTVESIKPPIRGSRISHSEFIRKCREQWRANERKPTMDGFLKTMDIHLQAQQLFLVCLLNLGQTELRSEIRSLIDGLRQQRLPSQADLPSPASPTSPRPPPASTPGDSVAYPVYTGLVAQAMPQCCVENAVRPTLWGYAISAVERNDLSVLEQVLEHHPDLIKLTDTKWTLFHQAVQSLPEPSNTAILKCLIKHLPKECDITSDIINARCKAGKTPAFFAVERRYTEALELLVEAGASVNIADGGGVTPLECANKYSDLEIMTILIKNGAYVDEEMMKKLSPAQRKLLPRREEQPKQLMKFFGFRRTSTSSKISVRRSSTVSTIQTRRDSCCSTCGQKVLQQTTVVK
ncbi:MAG: hypothetical protein M1840_007975 [Geoglossum simile]|nr:MAG: hypothetical protein M1840_007975 [Geoglossum simile]